MYLRWCNVFFQWVPYRSLAKAQTTDTNQRKYHEGQPWQLPLNGERQSLNNAWHGGQCHRQVLVAQVAECGTRAICKAHVVVM